MNQKTLPTLLGLLLTTILAISGGYLIQKFRGPTALLAQEKPFSVQVTNITSQSFTVSWLTEGETTGSVKINNQIFLDQRDREGQLGSYQTHYVVAENLEPKTEYSFIIISNGKEYQEKNYQAKTANMQPNILPEADFAFGIILDESQTPLKDVLVFLSLANASPLSALTNSEGYWSVSLSNAYQKDLNNLIIYDRQNQTVEITVVASLNRSVNATTTTGNDHPVPPIVFGQVNNFISSQGSSITPPPAILSPSAAPSLIENAPTIAPIILKNPEEGEVIKDLRPKIEGEGPPQKKIQIIVQSEPEFSAEIIIGPDGSWQWAPPQNLSPGEHTLTINYYDEENVLQTITRRFQVAAQESVSPAPTPITPLPTKIPTSTPTLIATPLPSPTTTPKPVITTTVSPAATVSGQPITGSLTPLIIFVSLGIVISSFAYFLINQEKNGTP